MSIPPDAVSLTDYERISKTRLDAPINAYLNGGAADEITLQANTSAWKEATIHPRVLTPPQSANTNTQLFGKTHPSPILIAPTAYHQLFHTEGELATAAAASVLNIPYIVSTQASHTIEDIAAVSGDAPRWFQLYIQHDKPFTESLVKKAEQNGYQAIVLTVDAPLNGIRNAEQRASFSLPDHIQAVNLNGMNPPPTAQSAFDPNLLATFPTWNDLAWLASITTLPILVKGILHPDDATKALDHGAKGIIVSNHGGRTLDQLPATRDVLPSIITAVNNQAPVLIDGGIRRGTDILQALGLGADAVLIGRPILHGLSVAGATGVAHVLRLLQHELEVAMLLSGCHSLKNAAATLKV